MRLIILSSPSVAYCLQFIREGDEYQAEVPELVSLPAAAAASLEGAYCFTFEFELIEVEMHLVRGTCVQLNVIGNLYRERRRRAPMATTEQLC